MFFVVGRVHERVRLPTLSAHTRFELGIRHYDIAALTSSLFLGSAENLLPAYPLAYEQSLFLSIRSCPMLRGAVSPQSILSSHLTPVGLYSTPLPLVTLTLAIGPRHLALSSFLDSFLC